MNNYNEIKRLKIIKKQLVKLKRVHSKANTISKKELLKNAYYNKYIIKEDTLIKKGKNQKEINLIIKEQKKSLNKWLDFLTKSNYSPVIKYWIFHGVIKMGNYNSKLETYNKRTKNTIYPFINVNKSLITDSVKTIENISKNNNIDLDKVLVSNSFKNIYTQVENMYKKSTYITNDGIWIKYNEGKLEDAIRLSNSIKEKNTHWCIENDYKAIYELCGGGGFPGGDIYIYYLKDINGEYTIPKIGIRMNHNTEIAEIHGVSYEQNLDEEMIPILEEKLKELPVIDNFSKEEAIQIIDDLKELTNIHKKTILNEELTNNELIFLYTVYLSEDRIGFGFSQDPLVKKIIDKRNIINDYNKINDNFIKSEILLKCNIDNQNTLVKKL